MSRPRALSFAVTCSCLWAWGAAGARGDAALLSAGARIIKQFDFNEPNNFEDTPLHWRKRNKLNWRQKADDARFPHFLEGRFDKQRGRDAPPSFRLRLTGGSLSYEYHYKDTPIVPGCTYRIIGHARPEKLKYARVYLTAYYLNRYGIPLEGTSRRSRLLGPPDNGKWHDLTVDLDYPPEQARFLGLSVWLSQPAVWQNPDGTGPDAKRQDARAQAWFDDIAIVRLPYLLVRTTRRSNLFQADDDPVVEYLARDPRPAQLSVNLSVLDAAGQTILSRAVDVAGQSDPAPDKLVLTDLPAGFYTVRLDAVAEGKLAAGLQERFVKLAPLSTKSAIPPQQFGVRLSVADVRAAPVCIEYLRVLGVGRVKLPLWHRGLSRDRVRHGDPAVKALLRFLASNGIQVTGVLETLPAWLADGVHVAPDQVLEAFGKTNQQLSAAFSYTATHYAGAVEFWQLGRDDRRALAGQLDQPAVRAVQSCRKLLGDLHGKIALALPHSLVNLVENPIPAEAVSLNIPTLIPPQAIPAYVEGYVPTEGQRRWVVLDEQPPASLSRVDQLGDLVKRIVLSRLSNPEAIYVPRCWKVETDDAGHDRLVPDERIMVVRTALHELGGARPVTRIPLGEDVAAYLFRRDQGGVLALWSNVVSRSPLRPRLYLGADPVLVDMWGHVRPLAPDDDGQVTVPLAAEPVFIDRVDAAMTELWASFKLNPREITASYEPQRVHVQLRNPFDHPIEGRIRLGMPRGWTSKPQTIRIRLGPGEKLSRPIQIKTPLSTVAGSQRITAKLSLVAPGRDQIPQSTEVTVGCKGLEMRVSGRRDGDDFIIRVSIRNRTGRPLSANLSVLPPDRPRMGVRIGYLQPGKNTVRAFVIKDCRDLVGRRVPIRLRQSSGRRFLNKELALW